MRPLFASLLFFLALGAPGYCLGQTLLPNPTGAFVAGGSVLASDVQSDGKLVIGGRFNAINGVPRKNLARLNVDGSVDMTWDPGADSQLFYSPGVYAVRVHGNLIYVGGDFTFAGGEPRAFIAAIDGTTGLATPWDPGTSNAGFVDAIDVSADGATVYLGGYFDNMGGAERSNIAAVSAMDGGAMPGWNPGTNGTVYAIAISENHVFVGGSFGQTGGLGRQHLADVDATTGLVSSWQPNPDNTVYALALSDGGLYVGGDFSYISGQTRSGIVSVDIASLSLTSWTPATSFGVHAIASSGSVVYFGGGPRYSGGSMAGNLVAADTVTGTLQNWNPNPDDLVTAVALSGSSVFVGGQFLHVGQIVTGGFAVVDVSTGTSASRQLSAGPGSITSLETQPDGKVIVGGIFTSIGSVPRNNLGRLNADGSVDATWDPSPDGQITTIRVANNLAYVAGSFVNIGAHYRQRLAALDLQNGVATNWQPDPDNDVTTLAISGNTVYVGGNFQYVGNSMRSCIAALDASTGLATAWNPNANGQVVALTSAGGVVYAGGSFNTIGGQPRRFLAAIDASSGAATAWDPEPDSWVAALLLTPNVLYIGGYFTRVGTTFREGVAAIDLVSAQATNWHADYSGEGGAEDVFAPIGGELVVGGEFYTMGGQPRQNVAVLDTVSGAATSWNAPAYANSSYSQVPVAALAVTGKHLFVGGNFSSISGMPRASLVGVSSPDVIFDDSFE